MGTEMINGRAVFAKDFFAYTVLFPAIAQNASQTQSFTIQADSDFALQKMAFFSDDTATVKQTQTTNFLPNCTILIVDTGSGRQLMNSAVPLCTIFGSAQNPFILTQPKIFSARSNITVTMTNTEPAAATYNIRLNFIGVKIFYQT